MIDKSIRQHYQTGEKVKKFGYDVGQKLISPYVDEGGKLDVGKVAKTALTNKLTTAATKKLAGTGILSSLGPIGMIIAAILAKRGFDYAKGKIPKDIGQAFTQGFTGLGVGSPEEQRELRQLEARRANMLRRREEGKNYSEKNLDIVTRAIAEAKGLDINNPNEMRNIDKPITQIQTARSITEAPRVIPEEPEIKSPFSKPIPKTPEVIIPHDINPVITKPVYVPPVLEERHPDPPAPRVTYSSPARPHGNGGGGNGGGGGHRGGAPSHSTRDLMSKGGRIDKALGGRSRDI